MSITNFEKHGHCSNCGQCCCDTICVTKEEIRAIAQYVRDNPVVVFPVDPTKGVFRISCPFRNEVLKRCEIYPVRPEVCKTFRCGMGDKKASENLTRLMSRPGATCQISLQWIFNGDPFICNMLGFPRVSRLDWLGFSPQLLYKEGE